MDYLEIMYVFLALTIVLIIIFFVKRESSLHKDYGNELNIAKGEVWKLKDQIKYLTIESDKNKSDYKALLKDFTNLNASKALLTREFQEVKALHSKYLQERVDQLQKINRLNEENLDVKRQLSTLDSLLKASINTPKTSHEGNSNYLDKSLKVEKKTESAVTSQLQLLPKPDVPNNFVEKSQEKTQQTKSPSNGGKRILVSPEFLQKIQKIQKEVQNELKLEEQQKLQKNNSIIKTSPTIVQPVSSPKTTVSNIFLNNRQRFFCESSTKDGLNYHCLLWYFPLKIESDKPDVHINRKTVYDFKDGRNSDTIASLVITALKNCFSPEELKNGVFIVIPASTLTKNEKRFKKFCSIISNGTGLENGFDSITINYDREPLKGQTNINKINNLQYHSKYFTGKTVYLFDDVFTTGKSFVQNATEIKKRGAGSVIGIFLARTTTQTNLIPA